METLYASRDLEELCTDARKAQKALGQAGFRKLRARLADLAAARCVTELVAGRPHPLRGDREGQFAVDLDGGRRLVFEPVERPIPRADDGGIAWGRVAAVRIVEIGDYHE